MSFTNLHHQGNQILPNPDGWTFHLEAENTSALIWMSILSRMQESNMVNLCHLLSHIVLYFNTMFPSQFTIHHIAVILNVEADTLSCHQDHSTYEKIFQHYPEMAYLPAYCVPPTLISEINACLSITLTKATLSDVTVTLYSIKFNSFKLGANN